MTRAPLPPRVCPRAEHPTSVAVLLEDRDGYFYQDRRHGGYPRSSSRRDRGTVLAAALRAGFARVVEPIEHRTIAEREASDD